MILTADVWQPNFFADLAQQNAQDLPTVERTFQPPPPSELIFERHHNAFNYCSLVVQVGLHIMKYFN